MTANPKPSIVFLHGSGTNPDIFRMQTRKLSAHLEPHFTLHYLAAPITCDPGPGVLPFFEGCEPYLTWMDDSSAEAEAAYWNGDSNGLLGKLVEEIKGLGGGDGGDVVGLVGFSMGGKVATEVVRRLEAAGDRRVKVVVPVCATVPLQGGLVKGGGKDETKEKEYREILARGVARAESVHLIGERDPWRSQSEMLVDFYDEKGRSVIRFKGEHHMPLNDAINSRVSKIILTACKIA